MTDSSSPSTSPKARSPAFPFIPLDVAVERLIALEQMFTRHPIPASKAGLAWQMKEGSSQAFQTLAALKYFGFVEYQGTSEGRQALLTDRARTYIRAQQQSIKDQVVRDAALTPNAIASRWDNWGSDRPPDPVCLDQLVLNDGFTETAAQTFLKVYDETITYAGLVSSDTLSPVTQEPETMQQTNQHETLERPLKRPQLLAPELGDMTVSLKGQYLEVSAFVDLKGAKRLMKAIKANIVLLEDDDEDDDED